MIPYDPDNPYVPGNPSRRKKTPANPAGTLPENRENPDPFPVPQYLIDIGNQEQHDNLADRTDAFRAPPSTTPSGREGRIQNDIPSVTEPERKTSPVSTEKSVSSSLPKPAGFATGESLANQPATGNRAMAGQSVFTGKSGPPSVLRDGAGQQTPGRGTGLPTDGTDERNLPPENGGNPDLFPGKRAVSGKAAKPELSTGLKNALVTYFNALAETENTLYSAPVSGAAGTGDTASRQDVFTRIAEAANADNLYAQPDPSGKYRNMGEPLQSEIDRTAAILKQFMQDGAGKAALLNREQEETENANHFGNWAVPVLENALGKADPAALNLSYQPIISAVLSHPASIAVAESLIGSIETGVNGREKTELVKDAFNHEFITQTGKLGLAFCALVSQLIADFSGTAADRERSENIDRLLESAVRESEAYLARSMPIEKCIVEGDDAQTIANLTQWYYELAGSKGPYAAFGVVTGGESLMAGAGLTGSAAVVWHAVRDFSINLALAHAQIRHETGKSDWSLAVKTAFLATVAGKAVEGQMDKLKGRSNDVFVKLLGDAFKSRIEEMIRQKVIENDKNVHDPESPDN